jgi:hypothetical protein
MMMIKKSICFTSFLVFLAFTVMYLSNALVKTHPVGKAIIQLNDWKVKAPWDDEKKYTATLSNLFELFFILSTTKISSPYFSSTLKRNISFLIPIFHQSNYLIHIP